jgi:hypothetical protein
MNYSIVGMNHRKSEAFVAALKPGVEVTLAREPDNKFDKNAVMVWIDGVHVGYIPKNQNAALAAMIDAKGTKWVAPGKILALDEKPPENLTVHMALDAKFVRSPNSGYPMAEVLAE